MIELPFQKLQRRVPLEIMILMLDMSYLLFMNAKVHDPLIIGENLKRLRAQV